MSDNVVLEGPNDRYRIYTAFLGKGVTGSVFKACDTQTNQEVAVKVISRSSCWTGFVTDELINHQLLQHHNVIAFKDFWTTCDDIKIVMEYANRGTLLDYVKYHPNRKLPEEEARHFFQQLMLAVDYCHKKGVANRDIKLENILLHEEVPGQRLTLKLCDWGYSKVTQVQAATAVGTYHYMAPQPLYNNITRLRTPYSGTAADVWSCGVCLYAMLTGSFPFSYDMVKDNSMNTATLYQRTLQKGSWKRREVLSDLPEPVLKLLKGMLAPKEDKRYTLQDIITHGWFDIDLEQGAFANNDLLVSQQQQNAQEDTFTAANIEQQMIEMLGPKLGARRRFAQT